MGWSTCSSITQSDLWSSGSQTFHVCCPSPPSNSSTQYGTREADFLIISKCRLFSFGMLVLLFYRLFFHISLKWSQLSSYQYNHSVLISQGSSSEEHWSPNSHVEAQLRACQLSCKSFCVYVKSTAMKVHAPALQICDLWNWFGTPTLGLPMACGWKSIWTDTPAFVNILLEAGLLNDVIWEIIAMWKDKHYPCNIHSSHLVFLVACVWRLINRRQNSFIQS